MSYLFLKEISKIGQMNYTIKNASPLSIMANPNNFSQIYMSAL